MERTIPQFNFDDQYLRMWRMISYAQCQDHHCVTSLLDITVRHIWNKEMRCWWYITHDGWWYLVIQQIPILIPITLTLTSSIHSPSTVPLSCHMSLFLIHNHILHLHSDMIFHMFSISTTLETVLLSSHPPPHPTGCISTTVFIIFLLLILLLKACNVHILLLDIYLLYTL